MITIKRVFSYSENTSRGVYTGDDDPRLDQIELVAGAHSSTKAHEFGHVIGFDDRYDNNGTFACHGDDLMGLSTSAEVHAYHAYALASKY